MMLILHSPTLILQVPPDSMKLGDFISSLFIALLIGLAVYGVVFYGLRLLFRRWDKEIAVVSLNVSQWPLLAILILAIIKATLPILNETTVVPWIQRVLTALIVAAVTYWIAQLFTDVIAYSLKKYAEQSEAMWDDVLVPILENVLPIIIYLTGAFLFLQSLGLDLTGLWVAFGGVTFILGFGLQGIIDNFSSGLVLLIDSPFQFGDVISLPDGSTAVIKKIGIRITNLFIIDTQCDMYVPNGQMQSQKITNLSRPAPHYYYSLIIPLRADTDPAVAFGLIKESIMAHPDTLGSIDEKLEVLDQYYVYTGDTPEYNAYKHLKREVGRDRLLAEKQVNSQLKEIHQALEDFIEKIALLERGGLETKEIISLQGYYLDITKLMGLEVVTERQGKRRVSRLEEIPENNMLIGLVRTWYKTWSKDPDLIDGDPSALEDEWERKIQLLKLRTNRLYQRIAQPKSDERKLDDYAIELVRWLDTRFKNVQTLWQMPKVWTKDISEMMGRATMEYEVKFFVDNITLEQCQRGYRVKSEVQSEVIRQLKQNYFYR